MIYNYHTHTVRCRHASGADEDYIKCAIEAGIKHLGFSDHAPFIFPDGYESTYRVEMTHAKEYIDSLRLLREKYKDQIDISVGFEMEYYPDHFDEMLSIARNLGAEYLILGQHYIYNEHPNGIGTSGGYTDPALLCEYVDCVIAAMRSGVFTYVAHPDMVQFFGDDDIYEREITRLCQASLEYNIPLEINLLGIRKKKHYPCDKFFKIAGKVGSPVVMGTDAHNNKAFLNTEQIKIAYELIERHNLNHIGVPKLINIISTAK